MMPRLLKWRADGLWRQGESRLLPFITGRNVLDLLKYKLLQVSFFRECHFSCVDSKRVTV